MSGFGLNAAQALITQNFGDAPALNFAIALDKRNRFAGFHAAMHHAPGGNPPDVRIVIKHGDQHLKRQFRVGDRRQDAVNNGFQQRLHIDRFLFDIECRLAFFGRREDNREIKLLVGGIQFAEQVEGQIHNFMRTSVGTVDFIHDKNRLQMEFQRFAQHEFRLRHWSFESVHQQQHAVHHAQNPLDFAAEISMAGGINNINANIFILQRGVFGKNRDASFPFQGIGIHDGHVPFFKFMGVGFPEQRVN